MQAPAQTFSHKEFTPLHQLPGLWKMETRRGPLYEEWKTSGENKLSGRSYKVNNADTMVLERVELFLQGGNIIYSPVVTGQNSGQAVQFKLSQLSGSKYVFENATHDYPQRVIYHFITKDSVHARIEGTKNGKDMGSDFLYSRVK